MFIIIIPISVWSQFVSYIKKTISTAVYYIFFSLFAPS